MRHLSSSLRLVVAGLLAAVLFGAACMPAMAQAQSDNAAFLESIRQSVARVESVMPQGLDDGSVKAPDLNQYELNYEGPLSLRRSFTRTSNTTNGALLGVTFLDKTVTEASMKLGQRTGFSFSSTETLNNDVRGKARDQKLVNVYGLQQSLGQGIMASSLGFTRTTTRTTPNLGVQTTSQTDVFSFTGGLRRTNDLSLKLTQTESDQPGGYQEDDFQGAYTFKFSGGDAPLKFGRNEKLVNGVLTTVEKTDVSAPFMWYGAKLIAEHHASYTESGTTLNQTRTTHFLVPLAMISKGTTVDYTILGQDTGAGLSETRTAKFVNPLRISGKTLGAEETLITLRKPGTSSDTLLTKLSAPLGSGQAVITHQTVTTATATGETEQRQLSMVLPQIKVADNVSVQAQRTSTETVGTSSQDVTSLHVTAQPAKPLKLEAQYQVDDASNRDALTSRQLHTKWAIANDLSLQGHMTEAEVAGGTENVLKMVELIRDKGKSGVGLRAGVTSYETGTQQFDGARRVEVAAGRPSLLAVSAAYSEYDAASMVPYTNDNALVALSVQHGNPKELSMRWRYEDQPTRVAPLQAVDVAMPALGGNLQVSYQSNPLGPDGSTVRQADQYDATLARKILGDLNMQVAYRYLDYNEQDLVDRNIRIQLDGGQESRLGKVAVAYFTGDFCTRKANEVTPVSTLDLSYARACGSSGKLTLTLQRKTPPANSLTDTSTEGRLELSLGF